MGTQMKNVYLETKKEETAKLVDSVDALLLDCDGVLWRGSELLPGILDSINYLREKGKKLFFVTNNSTSSRESYVEKMKKLSIDATKDEIFSSSFAASSYLQHKGIKGKVYVIGEQGLADELASAGYTVIGAEDHKGSYTRED